jgi:hypothetical protein
MENATAAAAADAAVALLYDRLLAQEQVAVARLGDPAAFERVREDLLDGRICVHPSSDILGLDSSQLGALADETLPNRHCFDVEVCAPGDNVDVAACLKAALFLSQLGAWSIRLRLALFDHDRIAAEQWDSHREAVDVLLDGVTSNLGAEVVALSNRRWGGDHGAWLRFVDRFAPKIKKLTVGARSSMEDDASDEVALSLQRFRSLEDLTVVVDVDDFRGNRESTSLLVRALPGMCVTVNTLHLEVGGSFAEPYNVRQLVEELDRLSEGAARSKSVKKLEVDLYVADVARSGSPAPEYDALSPLDRWLSSESLEKIYVGGVVVNATDQNFQRPPVALGDNYSVKDILVEHTYIGTNGLSILSRFKGLASITFYNVQIRGTDSSTPSLFASLENLSTFYWVRVPSQDNKDLAWIAAGLCTASPKLRKVEINLSYRPDRSGVPALRDILFRCRAEVSLKLNIECGSMVPSLCKGIEHAQSLTCLTLKLALPSTSLASVLASVQRNSSLLRFTLDSKVDDESCPLLTQLLSENATLEYFELVGSYLNARAANFLVDGLRRNRCLQTISLLRSSGDAMALSNEVSENLVTILQEHNTSLQHVEGVSYESREHESRINELLELNRYAVAFNENAFRVPMNLWGGVLNRIDKRKCNDFVRMLAQQALNG